MRRVSSTIDKDCPAAIVGDYVSGIGISASLLRWFTSGSRAILPPPVREGLPTNRPQFSKAASGPLVRVGRYAAKWPIY